MGVKHYTFPLELELGAKTATLLSGSVAPSNSKGIISDKIDLRQTRDVPSTLINVDPASHTVIQR